MAGVLRDLVDCERLAADRESIERVYELASLPRMRDVLADPRGRLRVRFEFAASESGRAGATLAIEAQPMLVCQRCLQGFELRINMRSELEFAPEDAASELVTGRELYPSDQGSICLRDLAEEELLLALPLAPACDVPGSCGNAPTRSQAAAPAPARQETVRPFSDLRDLLKKHDRT